jgi:hypothetical protein
LETRKAFEDLRRRTSAIAAGACCSWVIAAGASGTSAIAPNASSCALMPTATASGIKGLDLVLSGAPPANDRISLNASALCACNPCCKASTPNIHGFNIISISNDRSRAVNHTAVRPQCIAGLTVPAVQQFSHFGAGRSPGPIQTTTARLRVDNCNDLHRPRVHNHDLIADHEVIIPAPAGLDCYDRVWNRNKAD